MDSIFKYFSLKSAMDPRTFLCYMITTYRSTQLFIFKNVSKSCRKDAFSDSSCKYRRLIPLPPKQIIK